jgi:hypothetical protein
MSILIGSVMLNMKWIELMNVLAIPAVIYLGYALICQLTAGEKMRVYNLTVGHIRLLRTALITAILVAIGLALMTYITVNNSLASTADMKTLLFQCAETMSALLIIYSESRRKLDIAENNYEIPDDAEVDYYI